MDEAEDPAESTPTKENVRKQQEPFTGAVGQKTYDRWHQIKPKPSQGGNSRRYLTVAHSVCVIPEPGELAVYVWR